MSERSLGRPGPEIDDNSSDRERLTQLEAMKGLREGLYSQGRVWLDILGGLETFETEKIPCIARFATAEALAPWGTRSLERRKGADRLHPYWFQDTAKQLDDKRGILTMQLSGGGIVSALGIGGVFPERAKISVLDDEGQPIKPKTVAIRIPIYEADGETKASDSRGRLLFRTQFREIVETKPVSDGQLKAAILGLNEAAQRIDDYEMLTADILTELSLAGDVEMQVVKGFGASWKQEPRLDVLARTFRRPELLPGGEKESDMIKRGMNAWRLVGDKGVIDTQKGIKRIFAYPYAMEDLEDALRFATAMVLGKELPKAEKDADALDFLNLARQVPDLEGGLTDPDYLHARSIAQESLFLHRYFWLDADRAVWKSSKVVKEGDKYHQHYGLQPGAPLWKMEIGNFTSTDSLKIRWMNIRVIGESSKIHPYPVGVAKYIACALPCLTLSDLDLTLAIREGEDDNVQRLSFSKLLEMGVPWDKLPWMETNCPELHEKFNEVYHVSEAEQETNWQKAPTGPRGDNLHVPAGLQRFYAGGQWIDLTGKSADDYVKKMRDPGALNGENKAIDLMFLIMSGPLEIDQQWENKYHTIKKLTQYYKVHKLAAAYLSCTPGKEGTILAPTASEGEIGWGREAMENSNSGLLGRARKEARYLSQEISFYVPDERGGVKSANAAQLENDLFAKIIDKKRRKGLSPKETGWWTDEELIKLAPLFPYGIGFTQPEIKGLLMEGKITTVKQLDQLGWTSQFSDEERDDLRGKFDDSQIEEIKALAIN